MELVIVGFACYGLACLVLHVWKKPTIMLFWITMIAAAATLLYCKFISGFAVSQTWEYFVVLLFACTGFAFWLSPHKK